MRVDLIAAMVRKAGRTMAQDLQVRVAITAVVQVRAESESQARSVEEDPIKATEIDGQR
jgi:hypothetical protein